MTQPLSEESILARIDQYFSNSHEKLELCRGGDCAIFRPNSGMAVSSDLFVENIHFRQGYFTPGEIGRKALAVNLSDMAACGAKPIAFSLCLSLPESATSQWLDDFFKGMAELASEREINLCGGDISRSRDLQIAITIFGQRAPRAGFLPRGAALPGDVIFVAGQIGLPRIGLKELEKSGRKIAEKKYPAAVKAHLCPIPLVQEGIALAQAARNRHRVSLMDVSDGLAADLPRLLPRGKGFAINIEQSALHPDILAFCESAGLDPCLEAFKGGEDYCLVGTCPPGMLDFLKKSVPSIWPLGFVAENSSRICNGKDAASISGFDHFKQLHDY